MAADQTGRIVSLQVGRPKRVELARYGGQTLRTDDSEPNIVLTAIFKSPVEGRVALRGYNLEGDRQADLTVHGGPHKAVYAYASEHYPFWREELPGMDLPHGMFGENLTTEGWDEENVQIGDRFRIGTAVLQVSQPRMPCFKLGLRFNRPDIVRRFWKSGRSGIYFSVVEEGELGAGDVMERIEFAKNSLSVADIVRLYRGDEEDETKLKLALKLPLFGGWKDGIKERLHRTF
jgi:MOSC domain-containing protein YiiM